MSFHIDFQLKPDARKVFGVNSPLESCPNWRSLSISEYEGGNGARGGSVWHLNCSDVGALMAVMVKTEQSQNMNLSASPMVTSSE